MAKNCIKALLGIKRRWLFHNQKFPKSWRTLIFCAFYCNIIVVNFNRAVANVEFFVFIIIAKRFCQLPAGWQTV